MRFETEVPGNIYVEATADDRFYLEGKNGIDTWKIGMTREQAVKTARALMKMTGEEEKAKPEEPTNNMPPLGVAPYYIQAAFRIEALGQAIQNHSGRADVDKIREWASEIIQQCELISEMRRINREDSMKQVERGDRP